MTNREEARAAQAAAFKVTTPEEQAVVDGTSGLYDAIDALAHPERRLLITGLARKISGGLDQIAQDPASARVYVGMLHGLVALIGYANEATREESDETSTGDRRVDAVYKAYADLVTQASMLRMTPEQRESIEAYDALLKSGEDQETAAKVAFGDLAAVNASSAGEEADHYGLYL